MGEIILYLADDDVVEIVDWLNKEPNLAWIRKTGQDGHSYAWKAVDYINEIRPSSYALWKTDAGPLYLPSGSFAPATEINDPYFGWIQHLTPENDHGSDTPWFGVRRPQTFTFHFRESGKRDPDHLARSGFTWVGNYFRPIGNPAQPESERFWNRLRAFIKKSSTGIPWPYTPEGGRTDAYAFPKAMQQIEDGRTPEVNP